MINFIKGIIFSMVVLFSVSAYSYEIKKIEAEGSDIYQISMHPGEVVVVNEDNFYIVVNDIADYRCPPGMVCYWNGPFVLKGTFVYEESKNFELTYDGEPIITFNGFGYNASIVNVTIKEGLFWIDLKLNR